MHERWRRRSSATGESPSGPVTLTMWHGYTDVEADWFNAAIDQWNSENPDIQIDPLFVNNDKALQKLTVALQGDEAAGHHLPVRLLAPERGDRAGPGGPHRLDPAAGRELGGLRPGGPRGRDLRREGPGHPRAHRQPGHRVQQDAVRRGGDRVPERRLDVGRPARRGQGADRPLEEAVRLLLPDGRLRGLRLALRAAPVAERRLDPERGRHPGGLQLPRRGRGARCPGRDGGRRQVGLPRPAELALHGPVQQREDRDARDGSVGSRELPGRRLRRRDPARVQR